MRFRNLRKRRYEKSEPLERTVARLEKLLFTAHDFPLRYGRITKVSDDIWHCIVMRRDGAFVANGKGVTELACKASGLAEAVERLSTACYHNVGKAVPMPGLFQPVGPLRDFLLRKWLPGTVEAGEHDLLARGVPHLSLRDAVRHVWPYSDAQLKALRALDGARIWADAYDVLERRNIKIPAHLLQLIHGTNGLAAGNTLEEAVVQASNEVWERYLLAKVLVERPHDLPTIDRRTIKNPAVRRQIDFLETHGIKLLLKDISCGLPCSAICVALLDNPLRAMFSTLRRPSILVHAGVSYNSDIALQRAITEVLQGCRIGHFHGSLAEAGFVIDESVGNREVLTGGESLADLSFLRSGPVAPYRPQRTRSFKADIEASARACRQLAARFLCLDATHPEMRFPAVSVFMPGLRYGIFTLWQGPHPLRAWLLDKANAARFGHFWRSYYRTPACGRDDASSPSPVASMRTDTASCR